MWSVALGCFFSGLGKIGMSLPGQIHILQTLKSNNFPENEASAAKGISIWYCFRAFGGILGPVVGSSMYDNLGMAVTCNVFAVVILCFVSAIAISESLKFHKEKPITTQNFSSN